MTKVVTVDNRQSIFFGLFLILEWVCTVLRKEINCILGSKVTTILSKALFGQ